MFRSPRGAATRPVTQKRRRRRHTRRDKKPKEREAFVREEEVNGERWRKKRKRREAGEKHQAKVHTLWCVYARTEERKRRPRATRERTREARESANREPTRRTAHRFQSPLAGGLFSCLRTPELFGRVLQRQVFHRVPRTHTHTHALPRAIFSFVSQTHRLKEKCLYPENSIEVNSKGGNKLKKEKKRDRFAKRFREPV